MTSANVLDGHAESYNLYTTGNILHNISNNRVKECGSVVFTMVQFAIGNGCESILLVGCDCSSTRYNETVSNATNIQKLKKVWGDIKKEVSLEFGINILEYVPAK
tara:strand:+ start:1147 stop:1461 length:315 start_codon:yes stop_codon:yes gene_type:complete